LNVRHLNGSGVSRHKSPNSQVKSIIQNPRSKIQNQASRIPAAGGIPARITADKSASLRQASLQANEGFDWQSYRPEQDAAEKKPRDLNTASIALMARKIMAGEWAMALGKRIIDSDQAVIEGKAEKYRKKKAAERERKAIEEQKILKQRAILEETLLFFGRDLLKAPKPITPQAAEVLLAGALSELGECIKINWQPNIWRYTHRTLGGKENEAEKWQPHPCPVSGHHR